MGTVSFDRAAGYYDATRGLPADVQEALTEVLAHELEGKGPCLEVGVGTGRIALPLHRRGVPLVADWRGALEESLRVLVPNGAVLVDFGGGVDPPGESRPKTPCSATGSITSALGSPIPQT